MQASPIRLVTADDIVLSPCHHDSPASDAALAARARKRQEEDKVGNGRAGGRQGANGRARLPACLFLFRVACPLPFAARRLCAAPSHNASMHARACVRVRLSVLYL